jgi:hypothetical protein
VKQEFSSSYYNLSSLPELVDQSFRSGVLGERILRTPTSYLVAAGTTAGSAALAGKDAAYRAIDRARSGTERLVCTINDVANDLCAGVNGRAEGLLRPLRESADRVINFADDPCRAPGLAAAPLHILPRVATILARSAAVATIPTSVDHFLINTHKKNAASPLLQLLHCPRVGKRPPAVIPGGLCRKQLFENGKLCFSLRSRLILIAQHHVVDKFDLNQSTNLVNARNLGDWDKSEHIKFRWIVHRNPFAKETNGAIIHNYKRHLD